MFFDLQKLYETESSDDEETTADGGGEAESSKLVDLEDLGTMMKGLKKAKVCTNLIKKPPSGLIKMSIVNPYIPIQNREED